jgi:hypothetical protein
MQNNNPGYDFYWNDKYIDVKSSIYRNKKYWKFQTSENYIADIFLCIGYNHDYSNLNIKHIWTIPACDFRNKIAITISNYNMDNWIEYEIDTKKANKILEKIMQ